MTLREELTEVLENFAEAGIIEPQFDGVDYDIAVEDIISAVKKRLPEKYTPAEKMHGIDGSADYREGFDQAIEQIEGELK